MEWGISWRTVQRSMGSIPSVSSTSSDDALVVIAAAAHCSRRFLCARAFGRARATRSRARSPAWPATGPAAASSRSMTARANASAAARPTQVAGANMTMTLTCASDAYKFKLSADVVDEGGAVTGTWSETSRNVSGTPAGPRRRRQFPGRRQRGRLQRQHLAAHRRQQAVDRHAGRQPVPRAPILAVEITALISVLALTPKRHRARQSEARIASLRFSPSSAWRGAWRFPSSSWRSAAPAPC